MGTTTVELDIMAAGLLTSVGHDVFTACASILAGLSRPQPVEEFKVLELSTAEPVPLVAERQGLETGPQYLHCPGPVRGSSPWVFDRAAWRWVDYRPRRGA